MKIEYKNNEFSASEASKFAKSKSFSINLIGDSILFKLKSDRILIEWETTGSVSVIVSIF